MTEEELEAELMGETNEAPTQSTESAENPTTEEVEGESVVEEVGEDTGAVQSTASGTQLPDDVHQAETEKTPDTGEDQGSVSNAEEPVKGIPVGGQMMSESDLKHLNRAKEFTEKLNGRLGEGFHINHLGLVIVDQSVDVPKLDATLQFLSDSEINARNIDVVIKVAIGRVIAEIAAREDKEISQVISERNVCEGTGRSSNTVSEWVRAATELPEECFMFGLSMTHYTNAAKIPVPKDKAQGDEFKKRRVQVLKDAAESPGTSVKEVKNRLYDVSRALTMKNNDKEDGPQPESISSIWRNLIDCYRMARAADTNPEILTDKKITREQLANHIEYYENELINRNCITDAPENIMFYWENAGEEPIEAEGTEVDSSEVEDDKANSAAFKKSKAKADAAKKKAAAKKKTAAKKKGAKK